MAYSMHVLADGRALQHSEHEKVAQKASHATDDASYLASIGSRCKKSVLNVNMLFNVSVEFCQSKFVGPFKIATVHCRKFLRQDDCRIVITCE